MNAGNTKSASRQKLLLLVKFNDLILSDFITCYRRIEQDLRGCNTHHRQH